MKKIIKEKSGYMPSNKLKVVENVFSEYKESFKVLIINSPQDSRSETMTHLCWALGSVPWDIVIDLDHESRTTGMQDRIAAVLRKHKDYKCITNEDLRNLPEKDREMAGEKKRTLWILVNGCAEKEVKPSVETFGKVTLRLGPVLADVLSLLQDSMPVISLQLVLSDSAVKAGKECLETVANALQDAQDEPMRGKAYFLQVVDETVGLEATSQSSDVKNSFTVVCPLGQVVGCFVSLFGKGLENETFFFPGSAGFASCSSEEMTVWRQCMELYHRDIGKLFFEGDNEVIVNDKIADIKLKFLKGSEITPECLYLQEELKEAVYVRRKVFDEIKDNIERGLEMSRTWTNRKLSRMKLNHIASAGGTTCINHCLYTLRNAYPCVKVKEVNEDLIEALKTISLRSKLPILLVLDNHVWQDISSQNFMEHLNNDMVKSYIVEVHRCSKVAPSRDSYPNTIQSEITDPVEKNQFQKLYSTVEKVANANKVFLFGLFAYLGEYEKLEGHLLYVLGNVSEGQKRILRLCCMVWKYANKPVCNRLTRKIGKEMDATVSDKELKEVLGCANDMLIEKDFAVRPAHMCVTDKLIEKQGLKESLDLFLLDLKEMIAIDSGDKDSRMLVETLFTRFKEGKEKLTKLIMDLKEKCGKEETKGAIRSMVDALIKTDSEPHLRILLARYLMHQMNDIQGSIDEARCALGLAPYQSVSSTQVTDTIILAAYGNLLVMKLKKMSLEEEKRDLTVRDKFLLNCIEDAREAFQAFERAKKTKKTSDSGPLYNGYAWLGEAEIRYRLLHIFFAVRCDKDFEKFHKFLNECPYDLLTECEERAFQNLDQFQRMIKLGIVHTDSEEETYSKITRIKFDLLRLRNDNVKKALQDMDDSVPVDVGSVFRTTWEGKRYSKMPWSKMKLKELREMFNLLHKKISKFSYTALSCNYKDIIYAMIYIRQNRSRDLGEYNLDYALQCARTWADRFPDEMDAHFMKSLLLFIHLLEQGEENIKKEDLIGIKESGQKCHGIYERYKSHFGFRAQRYMIGEGNGLERIVPASTTEDVQQSQVCVFYGRQIGKYQVTIRGFDRLTARLPSRAESDLGESYSSQQERLLRFNLAFGRDIIRAKNVGLVDGEVDAALDAQE